MTLSGSIQPAGAQTHIVPGIFVTEARIFKPESYVVPSIIRGVLDGTIWMVLGFKGSGKTALSEYIAAIASAETVERNLCLLRAQDAFDSSNIQTWLRMSQISGSEAHAVAAKQWALLLGATLLGHLRTSYPSDPLLRRWWRRLLLKGLLPNHRGARIINGSRRFWRRITGLGPFSLQPEALQELPDLDRFAPSEFWGDLFAVSARLSTTRLVILLDRLDRLAFISSIQPHSSESPSILPVFVGLLEALCEIRRAASRSVATPQVSCLVLLRPDLYLAPSAFSQERTHIEALLAPVYLRWEADQLRVICASALAGREPAVRPSPVDPAAVLRIMLSSDKHPAGHLQLECFEDITLELSLADGYATPRELLDFTAELLVSGEIALDRDTAGPILRAPTHIIRTALDNVATRRTEDTLRSLAPKIDAILSRLQGRTSHILNTTLVETCSAVGTNLDSAVREMISFGICSSAGSEEIRIAPLYTRFYRLLASRSGLSTVVRVNSDRETVPILDRATLRALGYLANLSAVDSNGNCLSLGSLIEAWMAKQHSGLFVILGDYGSGKTTFANALFTAYWDLHVTLIQRFPLTFLLDLKGLRESSDADKWICAEMREHGFMCPTMDEFLALVRTTGALVILDSFDEMALRPSEDELLANAAFVRRIAECGPTVLFSRTHLFTGSSEIRSFAQTASPSASLSLRSTLAGLLLGNLPENVVVVQPLSDNDIQHVVGLAAGKSDREVLQWIYGTYDLASLARTPLFLDMIIATSPAPGATQQMAARPAELYRAYTRAWMIKQSPAWPRELSVPRMETALATIGFELYRSDRSSVTISDVALALDVASGAEEVAWRWMHGSTFLILDRIDRLLRFSHESFREYFAAYALFDSVTSGALESEGGGLYAQDYLTTAVDEFFLGLLDSEAHIPILNRALREHPSVVVRMNAATSIGRWWDQRADSMLVGALRAERDIGVAGRLAEALYARGQKEVFWSFLRKLDRYSSSEVDSGRPIGHRLLYDIDSEWRGEIPQDIGQGLVDYIEARNLRIRKYAVYVAGRIRCKESEMAISKLAGGRDSTRLALYVAASLGRIGGQRARQALAKWREVEGLSDLLRRRIDASIARLDALEI